MKRFIPLAVIAALMTAAYLMNLDDYLSFEALKTQRERLQKAVEEMPLVAPCLFIAVYALSTALSLPGGAFLSILGGFLFTQPWCTLYVVLGATCGAMAIFQAARTAFHDMLQEKAGPFLQKVEKGFNRDGVSYLLFLRLVPIFPFWLVNLAPAFLGVSLWTYTWTTFLGIIPGAFVFTQAGAGLGAVFDSGDTLSVSAIFNTQVKIALGSLGLFALMPMVVKRLRRGKAS